MEEEEAGEAAEAAVPPASLARALFAAIREGDQEAISALVDQGAEISELLPSDARGGSQVTALFVATQSKKPIDTIRFLVSKGAKVNVPIIYNIPLMRCCICGLLPLVKTLVECGADVNARDSKNKTALMHAAEYDHMDIIKFLIDSGADAFATDQGGRSVLLHYGYSASLSRQVKLKKQVSLQDYIAAHFRKAQEASNNEKAIYKSVCDANESALFSETFSDVVFICPDGRINAHRVILASASEYMSALLKGPWAENAATASHGAAEIKVPQSVSAIKILLRHLYTRQIDKPALAVNLIDVLILASQHQQKLLLHACERHLLKQLTISNVVSILETAHLYSLADVNHSCIRLIKKNVTKVAFTKAFRELDSTNPALWLELRRAMGLRDDDADDDADADDADNDADGDGDGADSVKACFAVDWRNGPREFMLDYSEDDSEDDGRAGGKRRRFA